MSGEAALRVVGLAVALLAAAWAALLALAEEAAVGEALHTLGDAPPASAGGRVPLHRALHVARLALLVLGAVAAPYAVQWWLRPWLQGLGALAVGVLLLFVLGDALPRSIARLAPELSDAALPLARRTLAPFGPLLWLLGWVDKGLHALIATPRPLQPDLGVAQRDMLLGVFTLADTTVDEVMTPRLDMAAVDAGIAEIRKARPGLEVWLEPGRYLVAEAGVLVATVTQTKGKGQVQYVGVSTGMNSLIRPALYGAYHEIANLSRWGEAAGQIVTIVGPICESGDRLGTDRLLPQCEEGDVLAIANAGAYGFVMSSRYNLREPAVEIAI